MCDSERDADTWLPAEPCLTTRGRRTAGCPARGSASGTGTFSTSSTPPTTSGGRLAASRRTGTARRWASSPARDGEEPEGGAQARLEELQLPGDTGGGGGTCSNEKNIVYLYTNNMYGTFCI